MKIKKQNIINFKRKVSRFGIALPLCSLFLTVFNRYLPYRIKHKLHQWKHCQTEKYIYNIIGQFQIQNTVSEYCNNPKEAPIWYCWLQGENSLPAIPRLCLDSLKKNANNHPVYFITSENYKQYVNIPYRIETLFNEGKISYAHFSDILRFNLINQNGGLWVDSTILLTSPIDEAIFEQQFYSIKIQEFGNFISRCRWCGFFIVGAKHNKLTSTVCDIFNRYWAHEDCLIDYFLIDYAINIAYDAVVRDKNVMYLSINTSKEIQAKRFLTRHNCNEKFPNDYTYESMHNKSNVTFTTNVVLDFKERYASNIIIFDESDLCIPTIKSLRRLIAQAEKYFLDNTDSGIDLIIIDDLTYLSYYNNKQFISARPTVIGQYYKFLKDESKNLLGTNHGCSVICTHQDIDDGVSAVKNNGNYKLSFNNQTIAASSDNIFTIYSYSKIK